MLLSARGVKRRCEVVVCVLLLLCVCARSCFWGGGTRREGTSQAGEEGEAATPDQRLSRVRALLPPPQHTHAQHSTSREKHNPDSFHERLRARAFLVAKNTPTSPESVRLPHPGPRTHPCCPPGPPTTLSPRLRPALVPLPPPPPLPLPSKAAMASEAPAAAKADAPAANTRGKQVGLSAFAGAASRKHWPPTGLTPRPHTPWPTNTHKHTGRQDQRRLLLRLLLALW